MRMPQYFDVVKKEIGEVYIEPQYLYEIPRFQRNYAWEESNVQEFWETIFSQEPVFLGTIIFNNRRKDQGVLEIIDGQQRYLTIQILAAVIRDTCLRLQEEYGDNDFHSIAKGVTRQLIGKQDLYDEGLFEFYLKTGDSLAEFFRDYIQEFDSFKRIGLGTRTKKGSEEERVKRAYLCFEGAVESALERKESLPEKKEFLKDLVRRRLSRHFFARIEIADEDLAYEIFETVNAKGVDLNVADLVKNQIFRHVIGGDGVYEDKAKTLWGEIVETVEASGLTIKDFISYYWSSKHEYVAERKLYRTIRERFGNEEDRWRQFLEDLGKNANYVKTIFTGDIDDLTNLLGDYKEAAKCFESLRVLRNTKAKTWAILYLCLFRNLIKKDGDVPNIPLILDKRWEIIAKFTFVYFQVMNFPGNWYFSLVCDFCRELEECARQGNDAVAFANLFSKELYEPFDTKLPKTMEAFMEGFASISYKSDPRSRVIIRYVLSAIESHLGGKYDEGFDENKVSIEHILPQDPKEWGLKKSEVKQYVNLIGNLMLIGRRLNGAVGNKKIGEKKADFVNSQLNLVKHFIENFENGHWDFAKISSEKNFDAIKIRGNELAATGYQIWVRDLRQKMGYAV
jgi:uncharacterized protein with ParB-like and HNH nuclease domain